jgi:hypothetical protein
MYHYLVLDKWLKGVGEICQFINQKHSLIYDTETKYHTEHLKATHSQRHLHLRNRLLDQGYKKIRLIRSLKKLIFRYKDLVEIYSVSAEKIINDGFSYSENV